MQSRIRYSFIPRKIVNCQINPRYHRKEYLKTIKDRSLRRVEAERTFLLCLAREENSKKRKNIFRITYRNKSFKISNLITHNPITNQIVIYSSKFQSKLLSISSKHYPINRQFLDKSSTSSKKIFDNYKRSFSSSNREGTNVSSLFGKRR